MDKLQPVVVMDKLFLVNLESESKGHKEVFLDPKFS